MNKVILPSKVDAPAVLASFEDRLRVLAILGRDLVDEGCRQSGVPAEEADHVRDDGQDDDCDDNDGNHDTYGKGLPGVGRRAAAGGACRQRSVNGGTKYELFNYLTNMGTEGLQKKEKL